MANPLRRILIALTALAALLLLGVIGGLSWLRGDTGRIWLAETIERRTDAASGFAVSFEALEGDLVLALKKLGAWRDATDAGTGTNEGRARHE